MIDCCTSEQATHVCTTSAAAAFAATLAAGLLDVTGQTQLARARDTAAAAAAEAELEARPAVPSEDPDDTEAEADRLHAHNLAAAAASGDAAAVATYLAALVSRTTATTTTRGIEFVSAAESALMRGFIKEQKAQRLLDRARDRAAAAAARALAAAAAVSADADHPVSTSAEELALLQRVAQLNDLQRAAYEHFVAKISHPADNGHLLRAFVNGEGGTGKSHIIAACVAWCQLVLGDDSVVTVAQTNAAAFNVAGQTINSNFQLTVRGRKLNTKALKEFGVSAFQTLFGKVRALIVDELGLVSCDVVGLLLARWKQAFPERAGRFGRLHVLLCGDFYQLKPVSGYPLYEDPPLEATEHAREGRAFFRDNITTFIELTTNYRHRKDERYGALCRHARF